MPTYDYRCKSCGHRFEQMQKISADPLTDCPECGEPQLQRLVNAAAFHLKGSGWYKTDYASSSGASSSSGGSGRSSTADSTSGGDSTLSSTKAAETTTESKPAAAKPSTPSSE